MHCHLHRGDWNFHLTNEKKTKKKRRRMTFTCTKKVEKSSVITVNIPVIVRNEFMYLRSMCLPYHLELLGLNSLLFGPRVVLLNGANRLDTKMIKGCVVWW